MTIKRFHTRALIAFLFLAILGASAIYARGESAGVSEQMPVKPLSCQKMIAELVNQLHAANQTVELLRDENNRLDGTINELENTIQRIRNDANRGGFGRDPVPQQLKKGELGRSK